MRTEISPLSLGNIMCWFHFSFFIQPAHIEHLLCLLFHAEDTAVTQTMISVLLGLVFQWGRQKIKISVHKVGVSYDW